MEMFTFVKGERVILTDRQSQTFVGDVKHLNQNLGRILLKNVVQVPGNIAIEGYRHFDKNEIINVQKFEYENHLDASNQINSNDFSSDKGSEDSDGVRNDKTKELESERFEGIKKLQEEYCYIRDLGNNFYSAVSLLEKSDRMGICGKDVSKGRCQRVSILAISTSTNIFLFDLLALGDKAFKKGLRAILESRNAVKVIHDSRLLSDCLHHKHLVTLENVLDVEAEDVMVVLQERRTIRRHSRTLEYLLKIYLGVEAVELAESEEDWNMRPLTRNLLEGLVFQVSFLLPLQEAIQEKYLERLVTASRIYNNYLRDLDFFEFLQIDPKKTLRDKMIKIVAPRNHTRGKISGNREDD